jgi:hypothetical protein
MIYKILIIITYKALNLKHHDLLSLHFVISEGGQIRTDNK